MRTAAAAARGADLGVPRARLMWSPELLTVTFCCAMVRDIWWSVASPNWRKLSSEMLRRLKKLSFLLLPQNQSSISAALRKARHSENQPPAHTHGQTQLLTEHRKSLSY